MRIQVLQHVPFEGPARLGLILSQLGHELIETHLYQGQDPSDVSQVDAVVVMGGPMSVHDEADYPWLAAEKTYIRKAIDQRVPVLGICLGAQLIAHAMGAKVYPNKHKEIGWFPLTVHAEGQGHWDWPAQLPVLHWHGETFELPDGATLMASTPACENQAFCIGRRVVGLQFHLEMDSAAIASIAQHCAEELVPGAWVQSAEQMADIPQSELRLAHKQLHKLLNHWLVTAA